MGHSTDAGLKPQGDSLFLLLSPPADRDAGETGIETGAMIDRLNPQGGGLGGRVLGPQPTLTIMNVSVRAFFNFEYGQGE